MKIHKYVRNPLIDIIKGIGIICIVAGHSDSPFTNFLYLFHVALFFLVSGFCYKEEASDTISNVKKYIKRKIISLYFPYVIWNSIFSFLHNTFIRINVYTVNPAISEYITGKYNAATHWWTLRDVLLNITKSVLLLGWTQIGGALWFISTLFIVLVIYTIIGYLIKLVSSRYFLLQSIVSGMFLVIGFCMQKYLSIPGNQYMGRIFTSYSLIHFGVCIKKFYKYYAVLNSDRYHIIVLICCMFFLIVCTNFGNIELGMNQYKDPVFLILTSLSGWFFIYEISFFLSRVSILNRVIKTIGQNTMSVLILHFLCFKIINYIGVLLYEEPCFLVAAFPVLYTGGTWWIAYLLCGIFVPLIIWIMSKKLVKLYRGLCIKEK